MKLCSQVVQKLGLPPGAVNPLVAKGFVSSLINYPHPQPTELVQLYLLTGLAGFGLIALWLAAFHAFLEVAHTFNQRNAFS